MVSPSLWHFDIDQWLNPFLPPSPLPRLPYPVSYILGYRHGPQRPLGNLVIIFWAFIGIFCSLALIETISRRVPLFEEHGAPMIVGSFGAAAVLEFYAIEAPLAQPRNAIVGQLLAALVGVSTCKLFSLSPNFQALRWLAASLSCASATAIMALTGTIHPPAGATALLAVVDDGAVHLGWYLLPVVALGCGLMLCIALLVNNIQRKFPIYWWTPEAIGEYWLRRREGLPMNKLPGIKFVLTPVHLEEQGESRTLVIKRGFVAAPDDMYFRPEEKLLLESLSERL